MSLVSIITPLYNSSKFIEECIASVLSQTYQNWEMIMVDDKSTDDTIEVVRKITNGDVRFTLIELEENIGSGLARNKAIAAAKGRYIAFLDSDDMWLPNKLKTQIEFMNSNNLAFTYTSYDLLNYKNINIGTFKTKSLITYSELLKTNCIGCSTVIYDTKFLGKRYFNELRTRQDYVLWLSILKEVKYTKGISEPLSIYRIRKESISSNKRSAILQVWYVYRKIEKLNLIKSLYYFTHYAINGIKKYRL
jgi:glycosyltransferase involved in cell wall biosynthesis